VKHPVTPDGRYFFVRGRLWRVANPRLDEAERADLVGQPMAARRAVRDAKKAADREAEAVAHLAMDEVERALGERGPAWWDDGSPGVSTGIWRYTKLTGSSHGPALRYASRRGSHATSQWTLGREHG
jgi:hypothetical protein